MASSELRRNETSCRVLDVSRALPVELLNHKHARELRIGDLKSHCDSSDGFPLHSIYFRKH